MNYFQKKPQAGFTLIELLVVIAVIGVLSGIVMQSLRSARLKSNNATRLSDIDQINKALELYMTKNNSSLPNLGSNGWKCIGLADAVPCFGGAVGLTSLTSALTGNISSIPKDPVLKGNGEYYLYHGNLTGLNGTGAYLFWYANNNVDSNPCGRGYRSNVSGVYQTCLLYIGR